MTIDGRWILQKDGTILTPGVNYGPRGLKFVEEVGRCIIAHSPGHSGSIGWGVKEYFPAEWEIAYIEHEDGVVDGDRRMRVRGVGSVKVGRKRKESLEKSRKLCKKATKAPKSYVGYYKIGGEPDKERLRKKKPFAEEVQAVSREVKPKNNDLALMMDTCKKAGKERQKEIKEYNARIREPDFFVDAEDGFGVGYWRVPGGIWKNERYKNGYHYDRGVLIDNAELSLLLDLFDMDAQEICEG